VLARPALIANSLASGELIEVLQGGRNDSHMAYWLLINPSQAPSEQVKAFCEWVIAQANETQTVTGES